MYGVTVDQVRHELYNAFGVRQGRMHHTPRATTRSFRPSRMFQPEWRAFNLKTSQRHDRAAFRDPFRAHCRSVAGQPPPAAGGNDCVQSCARFFVVQCRLTPIQNLEREERLPATITTDFQWAQRRCSRSRRARAGAFLILAAIFAAYVVLGILYESFIHPTSIISGLPSAGSAQSWTLVHAFQDGPVRDRDDRHRDARSDREEERDHDDRLCDRAATCGRSAEAAIAEAAVLRFRPIMTMHSRRSSARRRSRLNGAGAELRQPPTTATPSGWRNSAPAPVPSAIGSVPKIAAKVVIMIGRKRSTAGLSDRSFCRQADAPTLEREVDHHDRVLLHDADQHDDADHGDDREVQLLKDISVRIAPMPADGRPEMIVIGWMKLS